MKPYPRWFLATPPTFSAFEGVSPWAGAVLAGLLLLVGGSLARADTFDLHIRSYCPAGSNCGHASVQDYEDFVCTAVEEMNLEYRDRGFAFRPTVYANDATGPGGGVPGAPLDKNQYSEIVINDACRGLNAADAALANHWRNNVAAANTSAISIMIDTNWGTCCSPIATTNQSGSALLGLLCDADIDRTDYGTGTVWAHEMGHYWGLFHPFTYEDPDTHSSPDYDGDDTVHVNQNTGVADTLLVVTDTPDDPEAFENCPRHCGGTKAGNRCWSDADCPIGTCQRVCDAGHDEDSGGTPRNDHVWVERTDVTGGADAWSPHLDYCDLTWNHQVGGSTVTWVPQTLAHNAMSYWGQTCRGPVVVNGEWRPPFTQNQLQRMGEARALVPERIASFLPDVCANRDGDWDNDGLCGDEDNCPDLPNLCNQGDADEDEVGDLCDNCPDDWNPDQADMDGDLEGDVCDGDIDGDLCLNDADQHPTERYVPVAIREVIANCGGPDGHKTEYSDERRHSDRDGLRDCEDWDDDNDGLCDPDWEGPECAGMDPDPCPVDPSNQCQIPIIDLSDCPPPWLECIGGGCFEFFLKFTRVINPDPTTDVILDRFQIVSNTLYAYPEQTIASTPSMTVLQIAALGQTAIGALGMGRAAAAVLPDQPEERIRLEIWRRFGPTGGPALAAVVGEWLASHVALDDIRRGRVIRITPLEGDDDQGELHLATTWDVGVAEGTEFEDADGDGWPDMADNCVDEANPDQADTDSDGYGDRCDADLDNDGLVTEIDLSRFRACLGARLGERLPLEREDEADPLAVAFARLCRAVDLGGDGQVGETDLAQAEDRLGEALDLSPRVSPLPLPPVHCVNPATLERVRLDVKHLDRAPGEQKLDLRGEALFPHPADPATGGARLVVRTAQGRTLLDTVARAADAAGRRDEWEVEREGSAVHFRIEDAPGEWQQIHLTWGQRGEPGRVDVHAIVKGHDFLVTPDELPLYAQVSLEADRAATRLCAETRFRTAPETPNCVIAPRKEKLLCH